MCCSHCGADQCVQPQGAGKWNKAGTARAAGRQAGGQVERSEEGGVQSRGGPAERENMSAGGQKLVRRAEATFTPH